MSVSVLYVHVRWSSTGADDMVPVTSATALAASGQLTIVDSTPRPWGRLKPRLPLGQRSAAARRSKPSSPEDSTTTAPDGAPQPEEA